MKIPFRKKSEGYGGSISFLATTCKGVQKEADDFLKDFKYNYGRFFTNNITKRVVYTESYVKSELKKLSKIARKTKDEIKSYANLAAKSGKAISKRLKLEKATTYEEFISILRYNTSQPEYAKCERLYNIIVKDYGEMCTILSNKPSGERHIFWYAAEIISNANKETINENYEEAFWRICPYRCEKKYIEDRVGGMAIPAD